MRLAPLLLFLAFLAALVALSDLGHPPGFALAVYALPYGDKAAHLALAAAGAVLAERASGGRTIRLAGADRPLASGLLALALTLEEASQALTPHRVCDVTDLACTWIGIALGARLARALGPAAADQKPGVP